MDKKTVANNSGANKTIRIINRVLGGIAFILLLCVPLMTNDYSLTVANTALIYFVGALGISVMMGMCGYMMMCSVAFMGIGGFISANLSKFYGFPTMLSTLIAILLTGLIAAIIGTAVVKLNGAFFAFATMGLTQIVSTILNNFKPFSGGPDGFAGVPTFSVFGWKVDGLRNWYYFLIVICVIVGLLIERIRRTSLGRSLQAIRDNETVAKTLGINTYATKIIAFVIAAALAAFSGCLLSHHNTVISARLFTVQTSTEWFLMVMLGGVNSTLGTFAGTLIVTFLPEIFKSFGSYFQLIYGIGVIVLMIFMPMGLAGVWQSMLKKIKTGKTVQKGVENERSTS